MDFDIDDMLVSPIRPDRSVWYRSNSATCVIRDQYLCCQIDFIEFAFVKVRHDDGEHIDESKHVSTPGKFP